MPAYEEPLPAYEDPRADERVWSYVDPQGKEQGHFSLTEMEGWYNKGYFMPTLRIRYSPSMPFMELQEFYPAGTAPFGVFPRLHVPSMPAAGTETRSKPPPPSMPPPELPAQKEEREEGDRVRRARRKRNEKVDPAARAFAQQGQQYLESHAGQASGGFPYHG